VPTLLLPPQSGSHSCIVDLSPDRSQVSALRSGGLSRLYCLDWAPAGPVTDGASLDDHLAVLAEAVELLGGRVNLVGGSQGGWLAAMHAALHPRTVHSLTVAGAPIDFHADRPGAGALEHVPRSVSASVLNLWYDASRLFGVLPTDPVSEVQRSLELLGLLNDPDTLGQAIDERRWFLWRQEIPAAFRTWILEHLFVGNDLVAGAVTTAAGPVDLAAIECPVHIVLGRHDLVVPPGQVLALADHVSTPAGDITVHDVDAGHLGLFVGRRALTELWPRLAAGIAAHSR
ncbi:alpha/beta fold hydrolase, partial [Rhodococcus aetherivorans]